MGTRGFIGYDWFKLVVAIILAVLLLVLGLAGGGSSTATTSSAPTTIGAATGAAGAPTLRSPASGAQVSAGSVTFSGTGTPGSDVQVVVDGAPLGKARVGSDGTWTLNGTIDTPGAKSIVVQSLDSAGAVAAASSPQTLTIGAASVAGGAAAAATSTPTTAATSVAGGAATTAATTAATSEATTAATSGATTSATSAATAEATNAATTAATTGATSAATSEATSGSTTVATSTATTGATSEATIASTSEATSTATTGATTSATEAATIDATSAATVVATEAATSVAGTPTVAPTTAGAGTGQQPAITSPTNGAQLGTTPFTITGTGTPGSQLEILDGDKVLGTVTVGADGTWSLPVTPTAGTASYGIRTAGSTDLIGTPVRVTIGAAPATCTALAVGCDAWVTRVGGLALRLRTGVGTGASIIARLPPGTQMTLLEGPQSANGYTWWRVRTTGNQEGWLAGEELRLQPD